MIGVSKGMGGKKVTFDTPRLASTLGCLQCDMTTDRESSEQPKTNLAALVQPTGTSSVSSQQIPTVDLSERERFVLRLYRDSAGSEMNKVIRQSICYAISGGIFTYAAIAQNQPWFALGTYVLFIVFLLIRIFKAGVLVGVMPGLLAKYDKALTDGALNTTVPPSASSSASK